jgi:aminoglycoside phosphotransferase (APT) family kinase protein
VNILPIIQDPAFMQQAQLAIHAFAKDVEEITYIEHGADNVVALVNKQFTFRFPRNENASKRLYFETALLQKIGSRLTAVRVPELLRVNTQPFYSVAKYIEGEHLTGKEIQTLTEDEQIDLGKKIATFVSQVNQAISGLEIRRLRSEARIDNLEEPWDIYFKRLFVDQPLPNDKLRPIVDEHYALWRDYVSKEQRIYAIHDDLHPANLLFLGPRLNGIVDFGDANTGSIEEEMRWLYLMGDIVLKTAIDHYQQLTGVQVAYDHVRIWAIMHELSSYVSRLKSQQTDTFPFQRSQEHLRAWLPNFPL